MPDSSLLRAAFAQTQSRMADVQQQLSALDQAQAGETKSSAGDKFETSREMLQQERNRLNVQLAVLVEHQTALEVAHRALPSDRVGRGSVVHLCSGQIVLLATGLGRLKAPAGESWACISVDSPMGSALLGRSRGDVVMVNENRIQVSLLREE